MPDNENADEALELYWDDVRVAHRRGPQPAETGPALQAGPGDLVIGTHRTRILAVIKPDGRIEFGPDYKPDEAAMVFWEAMGRQRFEYEDRILLIQHMEGLLTRLGAADLTVEQLRLRVAEGDPEAGQQAGGALVALERLVHQVIELGRGLARRPDVPVPAMPDRIPARIRTNAQSDYEGREGIEPDPQDPNAV